MSVAAVPVFIRNPCPPGACQCDRERLLADPASDKRVLALTRDEEKRLLARLEAIATLPELKHMIERMRQFRRKPAKGRRPSLAAVAARLNEEGHRNRSGREWSPQLVHHVLQGHN